MTITFETTRRHHHESLLETVDELRRAARAIPTLSPVERGALVAPIVECLRTTLAPQARAQKRDHEAIRERVDALEFTDPQNGPLLQELLYGLYALVSVYVWREEIECLPPLDEYGVAYAPHPFAG